MHNNGPPEKYLKYYIFQTNFKNSKIIQILLFKTKTFDKNKFDSKESKKSIVFAKLTSINNVGKLPESPAQLSILPPLYPAQNMLSVI